MEIIFDNIFNVYKSIIYVAKTFTTLLKMGYQ